MPCRQIIKPIKGMNGVFEDGKFYVVQNEDSSSSGFTWQGGCTGVYLDDYWSFDRYLQDFRVVDAEAETLTYIAKDGETLSKGTYDMIEVKKAPRSILCLQLPRVSRMAPASILIHSTIATRYAASKSPTARGFW